MARTQLPFVSVVLPCYNEETLLGDALDSLLVQTYPKDRYELIVVDDGSTDNTPAVAARYPSVRYIRLKSNQGIASARNAGLYAAKGVIYVAFDSDCKAEPDWLEYLVAGYQDGRALGVGGRTVQPEPIRRLAMRYISMCDTLFAPLYSYGTSHAKRPHRRLFDYIKVRLQKPSPDDQLREVSELYSASASFLRKELLAVGGWDVSMSWIEDRDLSQRLQEAFPGRPFYVAPRAKMVHERGESLWQYLKRPVRRGVANFDFHKRNRMAPPIFPFPLLYIAICLASLFISPLAILLSVALVPQLLYFWWPYKFLQYHRPVLFLFPYIQLAEESMVIVGLTRGFFVSLQRRRRHAEVPR